MDDIFIETINKWKFFEEVSILNIVRLNNDFSKSVCLNLDIALLQSALQ
jgi:hypothetical protein